MYKIKYMFSINKRGGNDEEIDSNQHEIPKALKETSKSELVLGGMYPSLRRKTILCSSKNIFPLCNINNLIMEGFVRALRSPSKTGRVILVAACPLHCLHNQTPAGRAPDG